MSMLPAFEPVLATVEAAAPQTKEFQTLADNREDIMLSREVPAVFGKPASCGQALTLSLFGTWTVIESRYAAGSCTCIFCSIYFARCRA